MSVHTKHWLLLCSVLLPVALQSQKFIQIERYGRPKTERIYPGQVINYRYQDAWYEGEIINIHYDIGKVELHNRFIALSEIEALRYPRRGAKGLSRQLMLFGASWSGWALIGSATDNIPGVDYRWSDAAVTASSMVLGLALPAIVGKYKVLEMGKRRRLRLMDITIKSP